MENLQLKKAGLKITLPRKEILALLHKLKESGEAHHVTAEDVYRQLMETGSTPGLATIYRVLADFENAGIVKRHNFEGDSARFELSNGGHHDHIVCLQCGRVDEFVDDMVEERQKKIAQQRQYDLSYYSLVLYANCLQCPQNRAG